MSKKTTYIHAENNNKILSSNEVRLYVPPEPEKMKVLIWGKELCNIAEWNDFLKCVEEKTRENDQLKQQLAEKDIRIEELEGQFAYECECNMQLVDLQKQLEEKQNTIDEINKEFVQAVHDWKTLCKKKDKEIEKLRKILNFQNINAGIDIKEMWADLFIKQVDKNKQLAIQELEKVKVNLKDRISMMKNEEHSYLQKVVAWYDICEQINKQIKALKGE